MKKFLSNSTRDFLFSCYKYGSIIDGYNVHVYNFSKYREWLPARMKKDNVILKYLYKRYFNILKDAEKWQSRNIKKPEKIIWQFWWQGITNIPPIVQCCIQSVKLENPEYEHILITKDNYMEYIEIPTYILRKLDSGNITITHFSDILRMMLLTEYGGIWLDATVFCTNSLEHSFGENKFYTCKTLGKRSECVADYYWTCYAMSSGKEHFIVSMMKELLLAYWKQEEELIDYFLVDYFMRLIYDYVDNAKKILDDIPENNIDRNKMITLLNTTYSYGIEEQLKNNCDLYKLSWKEQWQILDNSGNQTVYGHILQTFLER